MAAELGWDEPRRRTELERYASLIDSFSQVTESGKS